MVFKSWLSYFDFSSAVKEQNGCSKTINSFLDALLKTLKTTTKRIITIDKGSTVARSQEGCCFERPIRDATGEIIDKGESPYPLERMKPSQEKDKVKAGRANPKGTRCLYVADDICTALAEIRPWLGSKITLYLFKIIKDLQIVDCSQDKSTLICINGEPEPSKREERVWADINRAFSRPVSRYDFKKEYLPTQKIAMFFKKKGFDGLKYKSSVEKGANYVFFDLDVAEPIKEKSFVYNTKHIDFDFEQINY